MQATLNLSGGNIPPDDAGYLRIIPSPIYVCASLSPEVRATRKGWGADPPTLDIEALRRVRPIVYALIQAVDFSLDDSTELIGRLAEIDRCLACATRER